MMRDKTVYLYKKDVEWIKQAAMKRGKVQREDENGEENISPSTFLGLSTPREMDLVGMAGEYAFSKYYGLRDPNVSDVKLPEGDDGYDFRVKHVPTGKVKKVEIKSTRLENGNLIQRNDIPVTADIYALCIVFDDRVDIIGASTGEKMKNAKVRTNGMKFPAKFISRSDLIDLPDPEDLDDYNNNGSYIFN